MKSEVRTLVKNCNAAFKSVDKALYSTARTNLKKGVKNTKESYKRKIEEHLTDKSSWRMWQRIQQLTNYKSSNAITDSTNTSLAGELNHLFALR